MMEKDILLSPIRLNDLVDLIANKVVESITRQNKEENMNKLLSVKEACHVFQPAITRQTLASWTRDGLLPKQIIGTRVFYKLADLLHAGKSLKRYRSSQNQNAGSCRKKQ